MSTFLALLPDLNAGKFLEKVDTALAAAAAATIHNGENGKAGRVTLEFSMKRIGESNQVTLTHSVEFTVPTLRGKRSEQDSTQTPVHVGQTGKLTLLPDTQTRFAFDTQPGAPGGWPVSADEAAARREQRLDQQMQRAHDDEGAEQ